MIITFNWDDEVAARADVLDDAAESAALPILDIDERVFPDLKAMRGQFATASARQWWLRRRSSQRGRSP